VVVQGRKFQKYSVYTICGQHTTKPYLQFCSNHPRDAYLRIPKGLKAQLYMHWPTLFEGRDEVLWEME